MKSSEILDMLTDGLRERFALFTNADHESWEKPQDRPVLHNTVHSFLVSWFLDNNIKIEEIEVKQ